MEARLVPVNAVLDLALADGLNPAPLATTGWAVAALEVPVRAGSQVEVVVCDVVLFNSEAGHLLTVEAKSGANLEPEQGRRLTALTPPAPGSRRWYHRAQASSAAMRSHVRMSCRKR